MKITITPSDIEKTEFFQQLSPILKRLTLQKNSRERIENGVNVATNIGFKQWEAQCGDRYVHRRIVQELVEQQKVTN